MGIETFWLPNLLVFFKEITPTDPMAGQPTPPGHVRILQPLMRPAMKPGISGGGTWPGGVVDQS